MFNRRTTGRLRLLALLALLLNIAYPAGYMPGDLTQGNWVVICPDGLPQGVLSDAHHGHGGDDHDHDESSNSYCPLGSHLSAKYLPFLPTGFTGSSTRYVAAQIPRQLFSTRFIRVYQTRAPPALLIA